MFSTSSAQFICFLCLNSVLISMTLAEDSLFLKHGDTQQMTKYLLILNLISNQDVALGQKLNKSN